MVRNRLVNLLLVCGIALIGCGRTPVDVEPANLIEPQPEPPTTTNFWAEAGKQFQGVTLYGISENSPPSLYVREVLAPRFAAETGIDVKLRISSNDEIEQIIEMGGRGPANQGEGSQRYDYVYIEQDVIYGYLADKTLSNLSKLLLDNPQLASPEFDPNDFTDFINAFVDPASGDLYGMPIEAFIKVYLYRTDLFDDPKHKAAFASEYHYPLAPAITFEQYEDIARYFTNHGQESGLSLWGTSLQAASPGIASFYEFFETIAPSFGLYNWGINLETNRATTENGGKLDSPEAVDALAYWINLLAYAPPSATSSDWSDVAETFAQGQVAQGWVYGEHVAWIAADRSRSQVVGKVGVALPPTSAGVMEDATIGAGYLGYYDGAAFGIPVDSQQKEAALLWLQYLAQKSLQPEWATNSGRIVLLSTFDDPVVRAQDRLLNGYYTLMRKQGPLFSGAPPFPFHVQVRDVVAPFIHSAIIGDMTPQQALEGAAKAADDKLISLNY